MLETIKQSYCTEDYQSWSKGMSTCGRWSALRVNLRTLDNEEFSEIFRGNSGFLGRPDNVATILTLWSLNDIASFFNQ